MMFSSDTSAQASSRSGVSLGQQIQQKSRQGSPEKVYGNGDLDGLYLNEHFNENTAVDEMDSACLGDTLMIGSISKVFEKDNNLSRRVHQLFESDESLDEALGETNTEGTHRQPHNNSTMLSFHKLIPEEASMMDTNNAAVDSIINYSGDMNVNASRIFTRLRPVGIGAATPYKPLHKNIDVKKPNFPTTNDSFDRHFKPLPGVDITDFSFGNVSIPSLNNTEYGDLPNFIDLSNVSNQQNSMTREDVGNNVAESCTTDDFEFGKKTGNVMSTTNVKDTKSSSGVESSIFDYKYLDQFMPNNDKTMKIDKEVKNLAHETNEFSKIVRQNNEKLKFDVNKDEQLKSIGEVNSVENLEHFLSNGTDKSADKKTATNKTKTNENTIFNIYNQPRLDDDTLKMLDPLQNEETSNFNISQALSNDSLAIQVKHLLNVTDADGSFENHKLLQDQIDLEKNKSLNYSNVLNEFENTELWDYVQKFLPSKNPQNESWLNYVEGTGDASPESKSNLYTQVKRSPAKSPTLEHKPAKSVSSPVKVSFHTPLSNGDTSTYKNTSHKNYSSDQNISKSTSTGRKDYSKISDWSEQKSSFSMDFDGYIKKTCENYLKEQKRVNSPEKSEGSTLYSAFDSNRFSSKQQVSTAIDHQHRDGNLSNISEEKHEGIEEANSTNPKKVEEKLEGETRKILDNLMDVEDSLRRSLGKSYQYRQVFGSTSPPTIARAAKSDEPIRTSLPNGSSYLKEFRSSPAIPPPTTNTSTTNNKDDVINNLLQPPQYQQPDACFAEENKQEFNPTSQQRISPQGEDATTTTATKTMSSPPTQTTTAVNDDSFRKLLSQVELKSRDRRKKRQEGSGAERNRTELPAPTTSTSAPTIYFDEFFNSNFAHRKVATANKSKSSQQQHPPPVVDRISRKLEVRQQEERKLPTYDEMVEKLSLVTTTSSIQEEEKEKSAPTTPTKVDDVIQDDVDRNQSVEKVEKCVGTEDLKQEASTTTTTTTINKQENLFQQIFIAPSQLTMTSATGTNDDDVIITKKTSSSILVPTKVTPLLPPSTVSVAQSSASMRSMMVQHDERSIPATPEIKKQRPKVVQIASFHPSNAAPMLPWLPSSLEHFKSLDDRSQANVVKGILKIFDQYDHDEAQPPSSHKHKKHRAPRDTRPETDSHFSAKYRGGGESSKVLDPSATQQTVQRLLSKIERQRESRGGVRSKKDLASHQFHEEESSEDGFFVKSKKSSPPNEKSYYVKLSSSEMKDLFEKKQSRKREAKSNANIQKKTKNNGSGEGGRVFHTSSPIKWDKSLKQMIQQEPEIVIQSLKHLLDRQ